MKKTKKVEKTEVVEQTVDIICNKCGKTCNNGLRYHGDKNETGYYGLVEQEVHGGYYSKFIGDMTSIKFSVCEECLDKFIKSFKIKPEIKGDYSPDYVTQDKYDKNYEKFSKENHKEWVRAVLESATKLGKKFTKKELLKKTDKQLYNLYHQINEQLRAKGND